MLKYNRAYIRMINGLDKFFKDNAKKIESDTVIQEILETKDKEVKVIKDSRKIQAINTTGISEEKRNSKFQLGYTTYLVSAIIRSFASVNRDHEMFNKVKISRSRVPRMTDASMLIYVKTVIEIAENNSVVLQPYGLTKDIMDKLIEEKNKFSKLMSRPRIAAAVRKTSTQRIKTTIRRLRNIISDSLDNAMVKYSISDIDFYNEYVKIRKIYKHITIHKSLIVNVKSNDKPEGEPYVTTTISDYETGEELLKRRTSKKGNLSLTGLEAGKYTISLEKYGYDTIIKTFYINKFETTKLELSILKLE